jgi:hypothetical protein
LTPRSGVSMRSLYRNVEQREDSADQYIYCSLGQKQQLAILGPLQGIDSGMRSSGSDARSCIYCYVFHYAQSCKKRERIQGGCYLLQGDCVSVVRPWEISTMGITILERHWQVDSEVQRTINDKPSGCK